MVNLILKLSVQKATEMHCWLCND